MNDIVSRLKYFLQQMGIATTAFADVCGIPRPSLSQLLNGRNKKVSNEVIDKIHSAYPELNMMWLMFGDGEMLGPNANSEVNSSDAQLGENDFPGNAQASAPREQHVQQSINFDVDEPSSFVPRKSASTSQRQSSIVDSAIASARAKGNVTATRGAAGRQITQVVIIYSDGSTQVIQP